MCVCVCMCVHTGVEVKLKNAFYEVLISPTHIPEMNRLEVTEEGLMVGGAVTLTRLGKKMKELTRSMPGVCVWGGGWGHMRAMYVFVYVRMEDVCMQL